MKKYISIFLASICLIGLVEYGLNKNTNNLMRNNLINQKHQEQLQS